MNTFRKIQSSLLAAIVVALSLSIVPTVTAAENYIDSAQVDKLPTPKKISKPDYPSSLKKKNPPPTITIRLEINKDGKVGSLTVVRFTDVDMVDPVYAAYETATFNPAIKDGQPVACRWETVITYAR